MRKHGWVARSCVIVAMLASVDVMAACPGSSNNRLDQNSLPTALTGRTACASRGAERWQEYHQSGGALIDYKKGPNDPVDPTTTVGSWAVVGNGGNTVVRYTYGNLTYNYTVYSTGTTGVLSFCDAANAELLVTMVAGSNGCGG